MSLIRWLDRIKRNQPSIKTPTTQANDNLKELQTQVRKTTIRSLEAVSSQLTLGSRAEALQSNLLWLITLSSPSPLILSNRLHPRDQTINNNQVASNWWTSILITTHSTREVTKVPSPPSPHFQTFPSLSKTPLSNSWAAEMQAREFIIPPCCRSVMEWSQSVSSTHQCLVLLSNKMSPLIAALRASAPTAISSLNNSH